MPTVDPTRYSRLTLCFTAALLVVLLVISIGRIPVQTVEAGMVASDDTFTMMTSPARTAPNTTSGSELLYVIDNDHDILLAYRQSGVGPKQKITLIDGGFIDHLFSAVGP